MQQLRNKFLRLLNSVNTEFKRYLYEKINWNDKLILIKGQRGVGKTTLMLQYLKNEVSDYTKVLYISLDDLYFSSNSLSGLVEEFVTNGGENLLIDEVHRYPSWSIELKNIYDFYPDLKVIATGSSAIALHEGEADLSRRASVYHLNTLSLREFLLLYKGIHLPIITLQDILQSHEKISIEINQKIKPIVEFNYYLKFGSYPFSIENNELFLEKLSTIINLIIDTEITAIENISFESTINLKKLLFIISTSVPFKPNIAELSRKIGTSRDILLKYLHYLSKAGLINLLTESGIRNSIMKKPEKIYLNNPNLMFALDERANKGNLRETFFMNQVSAVQSVHYPKTGDFLVNNEFLFEIGGKSKGKKQIQNEENAFIVSDEIEYGSKARIPLYLFGFLY